MSASRCAHCQSQAPVAGWRTIDRPCRIGAVRHASGATVCADHVVVLLCETCRMGALRTDFEIETGICTDCRKAVDF